MDRDLANLILGACERSVQELEMLEALVERNCAPEDADRLRRGLAAAIDEIGKRLEGHVYSRLPELRAEVEARRARYGRAF